MRIVMLWIYTILSPIAFLAAAFPAGQKYASQWWGEFSKNVIVGPVLAFFIWLALTTVNSSAGTLMDGKTTTLCAGFSAFFCDVDFVKFILAIGFLAGGLMVTQQMGGMAASIAGKGLDIAKKIGLAPLAAGGWAAKGLLFKAGRIADTGQMKIQKALGLEFPKSMNYRMIAAGWKADREKKMADYESGVLTKTGPLHTMWRETFNKYLETKQYGTVRKSRGQRKEEIEGKQKLEFENDVLEKRIKFGGMSIGERVAEQNVWYKENGRKDRLNKYINYGYSEEKAEEEVKKDEEILGGGVFDSKAAEKTLAKNKETIDEYNDPRKKWARKIMPLSAAKAMPYDYVLSKSGDKEREDKEKKAMEARTQQRAFALNNELIKAFYEKDNDKLASAIKILTQNNDLNEGLKDRRIIDIMTRQNGILEKMARKGTLGDMGQGEEFDKNLASLKKDFVANPVTPAHAQAMVRGMLEDIGVDNKKAARVSNDIGEVSFTAGNGLLFGSALGNSDTGEFEFEKLGFKDGRLQTSMTKKAAIAGKYTNVESQQKMRTVHPDIFIAEDPDGRGTRLTEDGAYFLTNSLTGHDLTQIKRLRADVVKKIGKSPGVLKDIKALVDALEASENEADRQQANHIKKFTGYIISKIKGDADKETQGMEDVFDTNVD